MSNSRITTWLAIGVIVVGFGVTARNHFAAKSIANQTQQVTKQLQTQKKVLKQRRQAAKIEYLQNVAVGTGERGQRAQQELAVKEAKTATKKFFKVAYTFDSQKSYNARKSKLSRIAAANVLQSKVFASDKDKTGRSVIETTDLISTYSKSKFFAGVVSDGVIAGNVEVQYKTSVGDNDPATTTEIYAVKYDTNQHKLIDLQRVGVIAATSEDLG